MPDEGHPSLTPQTLILSPPRLGRGWAVRIGIGVYQESKETPCNIQMVSLHDRKSWALTPVSPRSGRGGGHGRGARRGEEWGPREQVQPRDPPSPRKPSHSTNPPGPSPVRHKAGETPRDELPFCPKRPSKAPPSPGAPQASGDNQEQTLGSVSLPLRASVSSSVRWVDSPPLSRAVQNKSQVGGPKG